MLRTFTLLPALISAFPAPSMEAVRAQATLVKLSQQLDSTLKSAYAPLPASAITPDLVRPSILIDAYSAHGPFSEAYMKELLTVLDNTKLVDNTAIAPYRHWLQALFQFELLGAPVAPVCEGMLASCSKIMQHINNKDWPASKKLILTLKDACNSAKKGSEHRKGLVAVFRYYKAVHNISMTNAK